MDLQCDAVHMLWICLKFSGIFDNAPFGQCHCGPSSASFFQLMKTNEIIWLQTTNIELCPGLACIRYIRMTICTCSTNIQFNAKARKCSHYFQSDSNQHDRHTKSIQTLLHVTTSYASKQPKQSNNSQPSLTFLFPIDLEISGKFRKCSGPPLEALPEKARGSRCFILVPSSLPVPIDDITGTEEWCTYHNVISCHSF